MNCMTFVFVDHSDGGKVQDGSALTPDVLATIARAIGDQLNGEFAAEWGGAYSTRIGNEGDVADNEIEVAIFQNEDVSGAAGYHDRDPKGRPYIHVALDDAATLTTGAGALSVIISHECCETGADPSANRWADRADGSEEALETCDRVEDTSYDIEGVAVSNFLLRSAFDPGSPAPWDHLDVLTSEDGDTPGGYVIERTQGVAVNAAAAAHGYTGASFTRDVKVAHRHTEPSERTPEDETRYKKRKNHPASRTSRRGASMGA